jgi:hypothetical protein
MSHKELNIQQRCWVELIKNYNCVIDYHPENANMVANALIQKGNVVVCHLQTQHETLLAELQRMSLQLSVGPKGSLLAQIKI